MFLSLILIYTCLASSDIFTIADCDTCASNLDYVCLPAINTYPDESDLTCCNAGELGADPCNNVCFRFTEDDEEAAYVGCGSDLSGCSQIIIKDYDEVGDEPTIVEFSGFADDEVCNTYVQGADPLNREDEDETVLVLESVEWSGMEQDIEIYTINM